MPKRPTRRSSFSITKIAPMNMMSTAQASKSRSFGISQRRFLRLAGAFFWVATGSSSKRRSEANTGARAAKGHPVILRLRSGHACRKARLRLVDFSFNVITADDGVIGKPHDKGRVFFGLEDLRCRECGGSGDDVTGCV